MTTNDELLKLLPLDPASKDVLLSMAEANSATVASVVAMMLSPSLGMVAVKGFVPAREKFSQLRSPVQVEAKIARRDRFYDKNGTRLCSVEDCYAKHNTLNLCIKHRREADASYIPVLPLSVNSLGQLTDADGAKICKSCLDAKSAAKGMCYQCYLSSYFGSKKKES